MMPTENCIAEGEPITARQGMGSIAAFATEEVTPLHMVVRYDVFKK